MVENSHPNGLQKWNIKAIDQLLANLFWWKLLVFWGFLMRLAGTCWTLKCCTSISMLQVPFSNLYQSQLLHFQTSSSCKSLDFCMNCFKIVSLVLLCCTSYSIFGLQKLIISTNISNFLLGAPFFVIMTLFPWICYQIYVLQWL